MNQADDRAPPRADPRDAVALHSNISRWALEHPAPTRYLMVVLMLLGIAAYFNWGRPKTRRSPFARWWCRISGPAPAPCR